MSRIITYVRRQHIGLLALFIALGGTSYAAVTLPRNSVGAKQIRTNAVGASEIKRNAVTSAKVRNGSLTAADFKAGQLPAGAAGAQGPQGAKGDTGAPGTTGSQGERGPAGPTDSIAARLNLPSAMAGGTPFTVPNGPGTAITPLTWTNSNLEYEVGGDLFDADTAPDSIVLPKAGTYVLSAGVRWAANATGVRGLSINGPQPAGVLATSLVQAATGGARTVQNVSTTERFAAGAKVFVSVGQSSGGDLLIEGSQNQVHFSATYVGP